MHETITITGYHLPDNYPALRETRHYQRMLGRVVPWAVAFVAIWFLPLAALLA